MKIGTNWNSSVEEQNTHVYEENKELKGTESLQSNSSIRILQKLCESSLIQKMVGINYSTLYLEQLNVKLNNNWDQNMINNILKLLYNKI